RLLLGRPQRWPSRAVFSPDGKTLAAVDWFQTVRLWDVTSGKEKLLPGTHHYPVGSLAASPDGRLLASGSFDGTGRLWDLRTANQVRCLSASRAWEDVSAAFAPDGKSFATAGDSRGEVVLWDAPTGKRLRRLGTHPDGVRVFAFAP